MPFTPFHLGPALFFGLLLLEEIDFPTFVVANLVVDLRALLVLFDVLDGPIHGPLHTLVGGGVLAVVLAVAMLPVRGSLDRFMARLRLDQDYSLRTIALASAGGVGLHLLLDAFIYDDMGLLWPVGGNPLAGFYGLFVVYGFCIVTGVLAVGLYAGWLLGVVGLRTPLSEKG